MTLRNGVLVHRRAPADPATAAVTLTAQTKGRFLALASGDFTSPGLDIGGEPAVLQQLVSVLDRPDPNFDIVTP